MLLDSLSYSFTSIAFLTYSCEPLVLLIYFSVRYYGKSGNSRITESCTGMWLVEVKL